MIRKLGIVILLACSFTLGAWVAAWASCVESYDNCGSNKGSLRRTENFCVQDSPSPVCVCCQYYVRYYDKNGDNVTDCVISQTIEHTGDWVCGSEQACESQTCQLPTPKPSPQSNP